MLCKRCPHHVRHGVGATSGKGIEFQDRCGLKMREDRNFPCKHYPFASVFDYATCDVYQTTFKSVGRRNDVVPTKDFQYSDAFAAASITDMELL